MLLYLTWIIRRRFNADKLSSDLNADLRFLWEKRRASLPAFGLFGVGFLLTKAFFPAYWQIPMPTAPIQAQSGLTADGHPWVGAEQPMLEIIEFADYQCFQCKKMHQYLRGLVSRYPDKIRLVHRSFPMDHEVNFIVQDPFHIGSGKLSLLSIHAAAAGKFWEMNDMLYGISSVGGAINLREIAAATGMDTRARAAALKDPVIKKRLEVDIREGMKLGILGTPSYLINGKIYQGFVPSEFISAVINAERS
jgi:protein-disulfide isomerase